MNKKHKKMGFFQKTILAITDFRFYPLMLKIDSTAAVIGHFIVFMLILTCIMTTTFYNLAFEGINSLLVEYDEKIPEFTLVNGVLDVQNQEVYKVMNDLVIVLDTDYSYNEISNLEEYKEYDIYDNRVYINSDAITYESDIEIAGKEEAQAPQQILLDQVSGDFNKETLKQYILEVKESSFSKIIVFISIFMTIFFVYVFSKVFEVFLYTIMTSLVATISGIKLHFKNYVKIALYVVTLPYILETISMVYLGTITEAAFIVSNLLAYVYILYAIRAVKLDAFILIMNNPNKIKKSKDGKNVIGVEDLDKDSEENKIDEMTSDEKNQIDLREENKEQENKDDDNTRK